MDRSRQMAPNTLATVPHVNGGTTILKPNSTAEISPNERNLSYDDISLYHKYNGNISKLNTFLSRALPVARLASLQHDVTIDIENGDKVVGRINLLLEQFEIKGRRTIGLFGFYSITIPSGPHSYAIGFIRLLASKIAGVLDPRNTDKAIYLHNRLVSESADSSRVLQDGTTIRLAGIVEVYCRSQLHENSRVPRRSVERRSSRAYEKEPDKSYRPAYQVLADNSTDLPTVICEVGMTGVVSKVIFDCLSFLAGSGGKIDLSFGVDLAVNNRGLTRARLFVFDSSITTLVRFAAECHSVARFTRDKVENRLIHLRCLRDQLRENEDFRHYLHLEHTIGPTIEYYERTLQYLIGISREELTEEDIIRTCSKVLENAEVVHMTRVDGHFIVTDNTEEQLRGLAVKAESFLGLIVGFEAQVKLDLEELKYIHREVAKSCAKEKLEGIMSPIPLILTSRNISEQGFQEFVTSRGPNINLEAFNNDQAVTVLNVKLGHLREDSVITPAAKAYLGKRRIHSKALRYASALSWFREKEKERARRRERRREQVEGLAYNLADLDRRGRQPTFRWSNYYTNLVNELLDIHPTTPGEREYFRRVLGHREIKNFLDTDVNRRALNQIIRQSRSFTAFLGELRRDENEARQRLILLVTGTE